MTSFWKITKPYHNTPVAEAFQSLKTTIEATGQYVTASPISRVIRKEVANQAFFIKTYTAGGKNLRRWVGRSRARAEWENIRFFQHLGIPAAPLVAYGQETCCGLLQRAALVTAELENTRDLNALHLENHPIFQNRQWVAAVSHQVAQYTRCMHQNRFGHLDLKWRNILVTLSDTPQIYFIDCPAGQVRRGPGSKRWFLKDIACLDKVAKKRLSSTQRLKFFMEYESLPRLAHKDKQKIRSILRFFEGKD
ncbi:MAG: heptose kinase [Deltaproteobacteria bacterium]|jgi:serine/threonine-protein kinase RIO1|nr:heptose kinase [Deltaproteobacteria bacterium]